MSRGVKVIWEFIDSENRWIPYSAEVSGQLESAQAKSHTNLFLGDIDCHSAVYSVHFDRSGPIQINSQTGSRRAVRRRFCGLDHVLASGISWLWFDSRRSIWKRFSFYVQEKIEEAFQKGERGIDIEAFSTALPYVIHFSSNPAMQKHKVTGKSRAVRRSAGKPYPTTKVAEVQLTGPPESDSHFLAQSTSTGESPTQPSGPSSTKTSEVQKIKPPYPVPRSKLVTSSTISLKSFSQAPAATSSAPVPKGGRKKNSKPKKVPESVACTAESPASSEEFFSRYTKPFEQADPSDDCIICMEVLLAPSPYSAISDTVALVKCQHAFHRSCLQALLNSTTSGRYVQCPLCKQIHGVKLGDQPRGTMTYSVLPQNVPGYEGCGTICIVYSFMAGVQGPEHPKPGKSYQARGFPRYCYLPNDDLGKKVLRLLQVAWDRRLIFTIGQSVTTGQENTVTWNEIHHKTELGSNYSGHGYPDPNYLTNVMYELAAQGVSEEDLS